MRRTCALLNVVLASIASATPPVGDFCADVRDYLPDGHVTDGSIDYKIQIQKCFDENACVHFPGSDDPDRPMVYGITAEAVGKVLRTRPHARIRFRPNSVLKRLPSFGDLLWLEPGAHLLGAIIDGNKYAHWPLVKDRTQFNIGNAVVMAGQNLVKDCFVYNNAGTAFTPWRSNDNKLYRCRAENGGFLEAIGKLDYWGAGKANGDGFYTRGRFNLVKDSEMIDTSRWGYVITSGGRDNTFVDCRGGNLHFRCYGFIDVEGAGPGNSLVRCRSPNSQLIVQVHHQDVIGCTADTIVAEHAIYARLLACTTVGGPMRAAEVRDDRFVMPGRESPMVAANRVFLGGPARDHSLTVICSDGLGTVTENVVYGGRDGDDRSTEMLLYGVPVRRGNQQTWGSWDTQIDQFAEPYYLRGRLDMEFKQKFQ